MNLAPLQGERPLTPREEQFVEYFLADPEMRAPVAYARAFGKRGPEARIAATNILRRPMVRDRIRAFQTARRVTLKLEAAAVVRELALVLAADPRELIEYRRGACRYCHGHAFRYQRTPAEFKRDLDEYLEQHKLLARAKVPDADPLGLAFDIQGGVGFNPTKRPHDDCPECHGQGVGYTHARDTRDLSPAAARLYAGVKETKDGFEVKLRPIEKTVEMAMRHFGLLDANGKAKSADELAAEIQELLGAALATNAPPLAP